MKENAKLKEKINALIKNGKEKDNESTNYKNEIKKIKNENTENAKIIDEKEKQINSLNNIINDMTLEYKNKTAENEELKDKITNLEKEINDLNNELKLNKSQIKRNIKFNLDKNIYYKYLQNGLIGQCLFGKDLEDEMMQFEEKKDEEIFNKNIIQKKAIKDYNKEDIKINDKYILCENLEEEEIIPELYEDNKENLDENSVNELALSLRNSIDKSLNNSLNASLRKSIGQSYADGIYDSINGSTIMLSSGKGILSKLNQVFGSVKNEE